AGGGVPLAGGRGCCRGRGQRGRDLGAAGRLGRRRGGRAMSAARDSGLALRQVRFENRAFWRNPAAAFFTFVFPLMFLFIFTTIFGNGTIDTPEGEITGATFYVAAIVAFSVVNASFTNLAMTVSLARDQGLLKRVRGTPLPGWAFLFGKVAHA